MSLFLSFKIVGVPSKLCSVFSIYPQNTNIPKDLNTVLISSFQYVPELDLLSSFVSDKEQQSPNIQPVS